MLVLSRKPGETIRIGDGIFITVVHIGPNNVRIGIDAPDDVNIVREELHQRLTNDIPAEEESASIPQIAGQIA